MKPDNFSQRHLGPSKTDIEKMLQKIGVGSLDELVEKTIPASIFNKEPLKLPDEIDEHTYLQNMREIAGKNKMFKSYIGLGYYNTLLPSAIKRNILENPNWYTSYTPYQAEISQGRLEALLNFQTMVMDLTGMEIANASLLDEATAAAEAMIMLFNARSRSAVKAEKNGFFVDENIFPQTKAVLITRAQPLGIELIFGNYEETILDDNMYGCLIQYPAADGAVRDYTGFAKEAHDKEIAVAVAADLMSLVLITPPGEWDADVVVGTTQRFGIPMFYGGPHAAYFATKETFKRNLPGRIIGISIDTYEKPALRMALQTREQHIKRERATSNICTAQALLASMAGMYAVFHGPEGLQRIASNIHAGAAYMASKLKELGYKVVHEELLRYPFSGDARFNEHRYHQGACHKKGNQPALPQIISVFNFPPMNPCVRRNLNELLEIFCRSCDKSNSIQG